MLTESTEARAVEGALSYNDLIKIYSLAYNNEPMVD